MCLACLRSSKKAGVVEGRSRQKAGGDEVSTDRALESIVRTLLFILSEMGSHGKC